MALQDDALEACAFFDNSLPVDDNGEVIYPDSYAGRYIDNNNHLIIQVASSKSNGVVNIANLTITKIISGNVLPGDSGGGVFHKFGDGRYYFCGTVSGSDNICMAFSPVSLLPSNVYIDYV